MLQPLHTGTSRSGGAGGPVPSPGPSLTIGPPGRKVWGPLRGAGTLGRFTHCTAVLRRVFKSVVLNKHRTSWFSSLGSFQDHLIRRQTDFAALLCQIRGDKPHYTLFCSTHLVSVTCNQSSCLFQCCHYL